MLLGPTTLAAGGASAPDVALQDTFVAAMRAALLVSGLLAAAGAFTSLSKARTRPLETSRPDVVGSLHTQQVRS